MSKAKSEDGGDAPAPKSARKMMLIAGGVALAIAGGGAWWKFRHVAPPAEPKKVATFLDLPDITVNLAAGPGQERQSYLRLKLALELSDPKMAAQVQPLTPRLLDAFQTFLRELRASDLEGSAGLYRLKEELVRRTNAAVHPARIEALLFKDVLVQ